MDTATAILLAAAMITGAMFVRPAFQRLLDRRRHRRLDRRDTWEAINNLTERVSDLEEAAEEKERPSRARAAMREAMAEFAEIMPEVLAMIGKHRPPYGCGSGGTRTVNPADNMGREPEEAQQARD